MSDKTCAERVSLHMGSRLEDLRNLWTAHTHSDQECEQCDGTGEVWKECPTCGGYGDEKCDGPGGEYVTCSACNGEGISNPDGNVEDLGNMYEYGLSFDYVAPETFNDQPEGFFRYQLSTGGPGDEFRIYAQKVNDYRFSVYRIEYWFLDWFDGAHRILNGSDRALLEEIFESFFVDSGTANAQLEQAMDW